MLLLIFLDFLVRQSYQVFELIIGSELVWGPGFIRGHPEGVTAAGLEPSCLSRPLVS